MHLCTSHAQMGVFFAIRLVFCNLSNTFVFSPYFGKYIGCNFTGVAIQRCLEGM